MADSSTEAIAPVATEPLDPTATEVQGDAFPLWTPSIGDRIREAWRSRHLIRPMARRMWPDYSQTILGRWWLVIRPLMDTGGKAIVFGGVLGVTAPNGVPYFLFLLVGMTGWRLFQRVLVFETRSFRRFRRLTRNFYLPLLLVPTASAAGGLFELTFYVAFVILALGYFLLVDGTFYVPLGPELAVGFAGLALCLVFAWGVGLIFSVLNVRAEDIRHSLRYLLELWLYSTPVVYALEAVPERFQPLAQVNPLTPVMEMIKFGFLGAGEINALGIIWALSATGMTCLAGLWFFNRYATRFVELRQAGYIDDEDDYV